MTKCKHLYVEPGVHTSSNRDLYMTSYPDTERFQTQDMKFIKYKILQFSFSAATKQTVQQLFTLPPSELPQDFNRFLTNPTLSVQFIRNT